MKSLHASQYWQTLKQCKIDQDGCNFMSVNIDTFISNKCTFLEVVLAIYLMTSQNKWLMVKRDVPQKANCDTECFDVLQMLPWAHSCIFKVHLPQQSYHNNHNTTEGSNWFVAIRMSSMDFIFQMILWKDHQVQ